MDELEVKSLDELNSEQEPEIIDEKVNSIKKMFAAANDNVKSATEIFDRCVTIKKKLDKEKKELEKLHLENEQELEKIKKYKDQAYEAIKEKKASLDTLENDLKQKELDFENQKQHFLKEKEKAYTKLKEKEAKNNEILLSKNKELDQRKLELDVEKEKIAAERAKNEKAAIELEANLRKFNDVVTQFTSGIIDLDNQ